MKKMVFNVDGMVCGKCTARAENVMGKIAEINSLNCNLDDKTITVETSLSVEEMVEIIEDLGFDIIENQ